MHLKTLTLSGFKSFAKKTDLEFSTAITAIVGPNGSGKSNVAEAFRFALGEQSMKTLRGKKGEDLIWNGSTLTARANRASVAITFDNRTRFLNSDYDDVVIERIVHRDGANEYRLNGSQVRLRDVTELLAGANIGSSSHHIISQGEADRILTANPKERREMIEDALGLRVYQYKKRESARKLEKTEENRSQVEALRKESAPHLKFLARQMDRLRKAEEMRETLRIRYIEYLRREDLYLTYEGERVSASREPMQTRLHALEVELESARSSLEQSEKLGTQKDVALSFEKQLTDLRRVRDELSRELGRLEGEISALERTAVVADDDGAMIPWKEARAFADTVANEIDAATEADDIAAIREKLLVLKEALHRFVEKFRNAPPQTGVTEELQSLRIRKQEIEGETEKLGVAEREMDAKAAEVRSEIDQSREEGRKAEREMYRIMGEQGEVRAKLSALKTQGESLERAREEFKRELSEGIVLVGRSISSFRDASVSGGPVIHASDITDEARGAQEARRRDLEKLKIRLEEYGASGGEEVAKEFQAAKERDEYLTKELEDLERSAESLRALIEELSKTLDREFHEGVAKISTEFDRFFALMFGGGSAKLALVAPPKKRRKDTDLLLDADEAVVEEEIESDDREGVDVAIALPHKRIRGLEMLSGGERALTSIALVFAMSQVNPPPFLILDETDAALDEANSRRYGDMIENLAKHSQLILITHNRETMGRAGVLYGVTMGADGVSKLLSVKFEDAVKVAK